MPNVGLKNWGIHESRENFNNLYKSYNLSKYFEEFKKRTLKIIRINIM